MTLGPGKYDDICTLVREKTGAKIAVVIIVEGNRGGGFSLQMADLRLMEMIPDTLEAVAAQIRKDAT